MSEPPSSPKIRVFLSYSSEQHAVAESVHLSLSNIGHDVFFDRTSLPPGREFDAAILRAIRNCDLFLFLVSPDSLRKGAYTRTELRFAREVWPSPDGHVLPVMVVTTDFNDIPAYLKAVTILRPEGNATAEILAAVDRLASPWSQEETVLGQAEAVRQTKQHISEMEEEFKLANVHSEWAREREQIDTLVRAGRMNAFEADKRLGEALIKFVRKRSDSLNGPAIRDHLKELEDKAPPSPKDFLRQLEQGE